MTEPHPPVERRLVDEEAEGQQLFDGELSDQAGQRIPIEESLSRQRDQTWDELEAACRDEMDDAEGFSIGRLARDRGRALDYYHGRRMGNEREGRSKVVLTHVRDIIEWALPSMLEPFVASPDAIRFDPQGPEDVEYTEQAADWAKHVFFRKHNGVKILHAWFKDALREKCGYVKRYWLESDERTTEHYENLFEPEAMAMLEDPDVELEEQETRVEVIPDPATGQPIEVQLYDFVISRRCPGKIVIENIPPEDVRVARDTGDDLQKCRFLMHRMEKPAQWFIDQGFAPEEVDRWPSVDSKLWTEEEVKRETVEDNVHYGLGDVGRGVNRIIAISECYMRWDIRQNGQAELLKIWMVGEGQGEIIQWEKVDEIPFSYLCPIPEPHRHYGTSLAELVFDLQEIDSTILRQYLDNLYQANNTRPVIREGRVNVDDVTTSVPWAPIRVLEDAEPGPLDQHITFGQPTMVAPQAMQGLEYTAAVREERTGVSRYNQGLDPDTLNKTATGINLIQTAGMQRLKMILRLFASTGVTDLFKAIHKLSTKYVKGEQLIRLRGEFVPVEPQRWNADMDVSINVGLGSGDQQEKALQLNAILTKQLEQVQMGNLGLTVTLEGVHHTLTKLTELAGEKDVESFWVQPPPVPPPPPPPEPTIDQQLAMEQINVQRAEAETNRRKLELSHIEEMAKLEIEAAKNHLKLTPTPLPDVEGPGPPRTTGPQ